ncbi:MAG: flagellar basal body P-ring protein FlgI [Planctomycetota bacterium]|nr:flagellar basal body P-ring protein FlgI [Planctomycetota bacterium]
MADICRAKGQEEITLQGQGIIVGLPGTGDGDLAATRRSMGALLQKLGNPMGATGLAEMKNYKNIAVVVVTATVPAAGSRQGDKINCTVSSIGAAKSLKGGVLLPTALTGPGAPGEMPVYAFAQGQLELDAPDLLTGGKIFGGCRMEVDFFNPFFSRDGRLTLVLNENHSGFEVTQMVAQRINDFFESEQLAGPNLARAINQANIIVDIPAQYRSDPVMFVADVLGLDIYEPQTAAQVTINERAGSIVITADVEIGAVVVTHKNFVIETGGGEEATQFVEIDPNKTQTAKLEALITALKAVHAPTQDIIDIIKGLAKSKQLYAKLVIE